MNYLKEDGTSYNWGHTRGDSVSDLLVVDTKILDNGGFQFIKLNSYSNYWKPQGWRIVIGFQFPPRLRNLLVNMIMVVRLIDIGPNNMLLL